MFLMIFLDRSLRENNLSYKVLFIDALNKKLKQHSLIEPEYIAQNLLDDDSVKKERISEIEMKIEEWMSQ